MFWKKIVKNLIWYFIISNDISMHFLSCLWKESLNSDAQQFHQYQQIRHLPLTSNRWTKRKNMKYDVGNPDLSLGQV